jgi:hypothetical protein
MIAALTDQVMLLSKQGTREMATIQNVKDRIVTLQTSVESETSLVQSVKTLLEGQSAIIADLKQQLIDAINSGDPNALQAVVDALSTIETTNQANADAIAAAVVANTPVGTSSRK